MVGVSFHRMLIDYSQKLTQYLEFKDYLSKHISFDNKDTYCYRSDFILRRKSRVALTLFKQSLLLSRGQLIWKSALTLNIRNVTI